MKSWSKEKRGLPVVRLMGGLGNQMFQYALGRRLATDSGREVKFDVENGFRNDVYRRRFALELFKTEIMPADPQDIPLGMNWPSPWHRVAKAGWTAMPRRQRRVVYERTRFRFDETIVSGATGQVYYFGYWQHEGYFSPIQEVLRREFTLRAPLPASVLALREAMAGCRSVSVHVRRDHGVGADGKVIPKARGYHGTCPVDYYQRAVERIGNQPGTVCYIFSDNPQWAKANLNIPAPCRYVSDLCPCSDVEEMLLMASCQHHVISNSSFSWWGAWLGSNPEKMVVAPRIWIRGLPENDIRICPKEWVRM